MMVYLTILEVFYIIIAVIITAFIVYNIITRKSITNKVIGSIAIIMFILRILLIK